MEDGVVDDGADRSRRLEELPPEECRELLAGSSVGRLAVLSEEGRIDVVPVNFVFAAGDVLVRTHAGVMADRAVAGPVSFEIDGVDWAHHTGWSVLVQARGATLSPAPGDRSSGPDPWVPGQDLLLRITPDRISGRQIELTLEPLDGRGYL